MVLETRFNVPAVTFVRSYFVGQTTNESLPWMTRNGPKQALSVFAYCKSVEEIQKRKPSNISSLRHVKSLEEMQLISEDSMFSRINVDDGKSFQKGRTNRWITKRTKSTSITSKIPRILNEDMSIFSNHTKMRNCNSMPPEQDEPAAKPTVKKPYIAVEEDDFENRNIGIGPETRERKKIKRGLISTVFSIIRRELWRSMEPIRRLRPKKPVPPSYFFISEDVCINLTDSKPLFDEEDMERMERYGHRFRKNFEPSKKPINFSINRVPSMKRYSYEELMSPKIPIEELSIDKLERHLNDEDLMEHIGTPRCFLDTMHESDIFDRKLVAALTPDQYIIRRKHMSHRQWMLSMSRDQFFEHQRKLSNAIDQKEKEIMNERREHLDWLRRQGRFLD